VHGVDEVILPVDVIDVNVVGVVPICGPGITELEPVAAVAKAALVAALDVEMVLVAEM
jgi:hypothetical protein